MTEFEVAAALAEVRREVANLVSEVENPAESRGLGGGHGIDLLLPTEMREGGMRADFFQIYDGPTETQRLSVVPRALRHHTAERESSATVQ